MICSKNETIPKKNLKINELDVEIMQQEKEVDFLKKRLFDLLNERNYEDENLA